MNHFIVTLFFTVLFLVSLVHCDKKPDPKIGEPQFSLQASGGGNNRKNFNVGFNAGVGTRVWESKNKDKSLDLGVNYGQGFARVDGHTFKSKPQYGFGGTYRFGRK